MKQTMVAAVGKTANLLPGELKYLEMQKICGNVITECRLAKDNKVPGEPCCLSKDRYKESEN